MSSVDEQANLYFERPPPWKKYAQAILLEARIPPGHMGVYRDFIA
jgi:hypothetical protein